MGSIWISILVFIVFAIAGVLVVTKKKHGGTDGASVSQVTATLIQLTPQGQRVKDTHQDWANDICNAVAEKVVVLGMTGDQVIETVGRPFNISNKMNEYQTREEWIMQDRKDPDRYFFDNGVVIAIQLSK